MNKDMNSMPREATPLLKRGRGRLIIFSAPSGTGKSTIIQRLMSEHPELHLAFGITATTRPPRGQEQHGVDYYFLSEEEFRQRIAQKDFLEYEEVYPGRFYGSPRTEFERQLNAGQNVISDVDVKGGVNIKTAYGDEALSIFIQPPSVDELRRRLEARGTDTPQVIGERIARAEFELTFAPKFDRIIVNDDLQRACDEACDVISAFVGSDKK